jgi:hypothetical protein
MRLLLRVRMAPVSARKGPFRMERLVKSVEMRNVRHVLMLCLVIGVRKDWLWDGMGSVLGAWKGRSLIVALVRSVGLTAYSARMERHVISAIVRQI